MPLKIYNTLSKKIETFEPLELGHVKMYVCGPTVYDLLHVGNFRGAIFYNMVRHWLELEGYRVTLVYNYTDVDDKIIKRANENKRSSSAVGEEFILEFKKDFQSLGLAEHSRNPRATQHIDDMVEVIEKLVACGAAYEKDGEVVYAIDTFHNYGKLSGKKLDELQAGSRVDVDETKKNPLDFVLWKPSKEGEPGWDSPWGKGRPGWHIECSAMSMKLLGETIDIHGGGIDLIFPHHENEIAQTESITQKPFVKYWVHHNFIRFGDDKMSKSSGNVITCRAFNEKYHPEILKFMILSTHYRSQITFSESQIHQAIGSLGKIYAALAKAKAIANERVAAESAFASQMKTLEDEAKGAMNDDFNTSVVFSKFYEAVRLFNAAYGPQQKPARSMSGNANTFLNWVLRYGKLMALFQEVPQEFLKTLDLMLLRLKNISASEVEQKVNARIEARKQKDFQMADQIREELTVMGIEIRDVASGSEWEVKKGDPGWD